MLLTGEQTMRHVDFSPLYRSTVGFDRLFTMLDSLAQPDSGQTYPPYNIERTGEDAYRISMAVAGFSEKDIAIEAHRNVLSVKGERKDETNGDGSEVLYRGIAARSFERRFQLADHVEVLGAELKNGLLHIDLKRSVPEELKPRKIERRKVPLFFARARPLLVVPGEEAVGCRWTTTSAENHRTRMMSGVAR
jgi:molecular chaperone IbpA